ncbi:NAD-dependent epimerase/dehydratase family protein [Photobacterium rosenbergii]|uniref:NAD-dependent epimerase/dehydratase family protein n=1 Tax=Photobacterium rosenbergii TaxID=294936 RepID=UPI001C9A15BF|nr:NAD-dependent epimerase/dehydratase family protein [Photobacterium rosenbergii]MBY5947435.1 NAD-dependent epimerase/dehydratase family protein [Photobacterium rosenbergii]
MYLVTGANGFIGKELLKSNCNFKSLYRLSVCDKVEPYYCIDKLDGSTQFGSAFEDVEAIIHLAGLAHSKSFSSQDYQTVNVEGTLNLAKQAAAAGVKRFVFVSSIGVHGFTLNGKITEQTRVNPHNEYAKSKYDAELGLSEISKETGLEIVIVRPTLVYGFNAPGNFGSLSSLISRFPFLPFGMVENKRDFISVQNLTDLLITCAKHPNAAGQIFLASEGETVSTKEFTNAIAGGLNKTIIQLPVPVKLMKLVAKMTGRSAMIEQLVGNFEVDSSHAKATLGWQPPYTMKESMKTLIENKK